MKNVLPIILILASAVSCGQKNSNENTSQATQNKSGERLEMISRMPLEEFQTEDEYPLISMEEVNSLYGVIFKKLNSGADAQEVAPLVWLLLDGLHRNWEKTGPQTWQDKLENLGSQDEELQKIVDIFLESEGLKKISELTYITSNEEDPNKKAILERRSILQIHSALETKEGINLLLPSPGQDKITEVAIEEFIQKAISSESIGQPVKSNYPNSPYELPSLRWRGALVSDFSGTQTIDSDYVPGLRFGARKEWASAHGGAMAHAFLTANMASQNFGDSITYTVNIKSEVRGGGKRTAQGGFKDKSSNASFDLVGETTIPGCDDLRKCSPFVEVMIKRIQVVPGADVRIFVNDIQLKTDVTQLDRTQGQSLLKVFIQGNRYHSGKSGEIDDQLVVDLEIRQKNPDSQETNPFQNTKLPVNAIETHQWAANFDKGLLQSLMDEQAGSFVFRHLKFFDEYLKRQTELSLNEISLVKVLNDYIIRESNDRYVPVINKLIEEKKRTLLRLPLEEMLQLFKASFAQDMDDAKFQSNHERLMKALVRIGPSILQEAGLDIQVLEKSIPKRYLMASFYKKVSDSLTTFAEDLNKDIQSLELEKAQIMHLQYGEKQLESKAEIRDVLSLPQYRQV